MEKKGIILIKNKSLLELSSVFGVRVGSTDLQCCTLTGSSSTESFSVKTIHHENPTYICLQTI